jgi:glycosyltransferase involved in cell wall biosynthesis
MKKKITIILSDKIGGVTSVFINLVEYTKSFFEYDFVLLHKKEFNQDGVSKILETKKIKYRILNYSELENKFYVLKRIARSIKKDSIIIANDYLELEAICVMKLKNKVLKYVHGTFESEFAIIEKYHSMLDRIICVSDFIKTKIISLIPDSEKKVIYLKHVMPVPDIFRSEKDKTELRLIYIGRYMKSKGADDLIFLQNKLFELGLPIRWTYITNGIGEDNFKLQLLDINNTTFYSNINSTKVFQLLSVNDLLVFPSYSEGFPLAVIEAMQCGVIPLVYNLNSGIPEIVIDEKTGYKFNIGSVYELLQKIVELCFDSKMLRKLSVNSQSFILKYFNPEYEALQFKILVDDLVNINTGRKELKDPFFKKNGLDNIYMPNLLVFLIRWVKNYLKIFQNRKSRLII